MVLPVELPLVVAVAIGFVGSYVAVPVAVRGSPPVGWSVVADPWLVPVTLATPEVLGPEVLGPVVLRPVVLL